jgi:hypothetical protein
MSLIIHIKVFNEILDQFFDYLETEFPDFKSDIILTRTGVEFIRSSNPRLVVEQFITMIQPFRTQIFDCDEDFFLNFKLVPGQMTNENSLLCVKVKNIWLSDTTTNTQKAHIWFYFQKLIKAGDKIKIN